MHRRRGFTLIELLVVIAIIAVLIALSASSGASGQRSSRGAFHARTISSRSAWPSTTTSLPSEVMPPGRFNSHIAGHGNCWGAYSQLAPYLEQTNIYNAFNFNLPPDTDVLAVSNATGFQTFLTTLLCPTDSAPELITVSGVQFATHNYNLNTGSGYSVLQNPLTPLVGAANGPFFENSRMTPASFTDGMSNTAAVSEIVRSTSNSTYATDPLNVFLVTGNNSTTGPPISSDADYAALCLSLPSTTTQFQATKGVRWHYGAPGHSLYNHLRPPNDKQPDCRGGLPHSTRADPLWSWLSLNITTRSKHPGGVNTLMADGHVQFMKNSINFTRLAGPRQPQRRRSHQF